MKGDRGLQGDRGDIGPQGASGPEGIQGPPGPKGNKVRDELTNICIHTYYSSFIRETRDLVEQMVKQDQWVQVERKEQL